MTEEASTVKCCLVITLCHHILSISTIIAILNQLFSLVLHIPQKMLKMCCLLLPSTIYINHLTGLDLAKDHLKRGNDELRFT